MIEEPVETFVTTLNKLDDDRGPASFNSAPTAYVKGSPSDYQIHDRSSHQVN